MAVAHMICRGLVRVYQRPLYRFDVQYIANTLHAAAMVKDTMNAMSKGVALANNADKSMVVLFMMIPLCGSSIVW